MQIRNLLCAAVFVVSCVPIAQAEEATTQANVPELELAVVVDEDNSLPAQVAALVKKVASFLVARTGDNMLLGSGLEEEIPQPDRIPLPEVNPLNSIKGFEGQYDTDIFTGGAAFSYPITIPPGRKGIQPGITLSYSSHERRFDSLVGYGWRLPTNAIFRSTPKGIDQLYTDSVFSADIFGHTEELIYVNGKYAPKTEGSFSSFEFSGESWTATDTSGTRYIFGTSEATRQNSGSEKVYKWMLERVEDRNGNFLTLSYFKDNGQIYPDTIRYTGHGSSNGIYELKFIREERFRNVISFNTGFHVETRYRIGRIEIYSHHSGTAQLVRKYDFDYDDTDSTAETLALIEVKSSSSSLPSTRFDYYDGSESTPEQRIHLLKKITHPLSGTTELIYQPSVAYRTEGEDLANKNLPFTIHTIHSQTVRAGVAQPAYTTIYDYSGGHYFFDHADSYKREYAGFHTVTITDPVGNVNKKHFHQSEFAEDNSVSVLLGEFEDHIAKKGRIYRDEYFDDSENLFSVAINRWGKVQLTDDDPESERHFPFLARQTQLQFDGGVNSRARAKEFSYDDFGNVIVEVDYGEVEINGEAGDFTDILEDKITSTTDYVQNEAARIVTLPYQTESKDFANNLIAEQRTYYDDLALGQVEKGNATKTETHSAASDFITTQTQYNSQGLPTQTTNPRNFTTTVTYDSYNLYPITSTDPRGRLTNYSYDYRFGAVAETTDPNGARSKVVYDDLGRLNEKQVSDPANPAELLTAETYTYNFNTVPASIQTERITGNAEISILGKSYLDGFGRQIQVRAEAEDADQFVVSSVIYDARGNVQKELLPQAETGIAFTTIDVNEPGTVYSYDALNRVTELTTSLGSTTTSYNLWEQSVTDPNGNQKDFVFDAREQLIEVREYLNSSAHSTHYSYDAQGNLIQITDAAGNEKEFTYDLLGRQLTAELLHDSANPNPGTFTFAYDENSNLISSADPKNQTVIYSYDELDRVLTETFNSEVQATYIYDEGDYALGRLSSVVTPSVEKNFSYDILGRILSEEKTIDSQSYTTAFTYDLLGNLLTLTYPSNTIVGYFYNEAGQVEIIQKDGANIVTNFAYAPTGAIAQIDFANGVSTTNNYDIEQLYRLTNKTTTETQNLASLQDISYTFDSVGNVTRIVDSSETATAKTANYSYDDLYRLTYVNVNATANNENYNRSYSYGITGNITNKSDVGAYTYTADHPQAVTAAADRTFAYDANGNLTSDGVFTHSWDHQNRLVSSTDGETTITYSYDEAGSRIKKSNAAAGSNTIYLNRYFDIENENAKEHIYAGELKIATGTSEIATSGDPGSGCHPPAAGDWIVSTSCTFDGDMAATGDMIVEPTAVLTIAANAVLSVDFHNHKLLVRSGAGVLVQQGATLRQSGASSVNDIVYHHTDHLSGSNVETDANGNVIELLDYYPYGSVRLNEKSGTYENDYKFTGKELDEDTDLYYYGARYYDSAIGRFISIDPWSGDLSNPQTLNKYSYVTNNPLKYVDPSGEYAKDVHYDLTFFLGQAAGLSYDQAAGVALWNQYVDENSGTRPDSYSNWRSGVTHKYHFAFGQRSVIGDLNNKQTGGEADYIERFGTFLHTFQDTYSHAGLTPGQHAKKGEKPDLTYLDPEKALEMAESSFLLIRDLNLNLNGSDQTLGEYNSETQKLWNTISGLTDEYLKKVDKSDTGITRAANLSKNGSSIEKRKD